MKIDIQTKTFALTYSLKKHTERKVKTSLSACNSQLKKVVIRLSDLGRVKGGKDKLCHIQVIPTHANMPDVIVSSTENDMQRAIDKATYLLAS